MTTQHRITTHNVDFFYGKKQALHGVNLAFSENREIA